MSYIRIFVLVVTKPPYEITETGWGEFEIIIKIFFIDPNERPVSVQLLYRVCRMDSSACLILILFVSRLLFTIC